MEPNKSLNSNPSTQHSITEKEDDIKITLWAGEEFVFSEDNSEDGVEG